MSRVRWANGVAIVVMLVGGAARAAEPVSLNATLAPYLAATTCRRAPARWCWTVAWSPLAPWAGDEPAPALPSLVNDRLQLGPT